MTECSCCWGRRAGTGSPPTSPATASCFTGTGRPHVRAHPRRAFGFTSSGNTRSSRGGHRRLCLEAPATRPRPHARRHGIADADARRSDHFRRVLRDPGVDHVHHHHRHRRRRRQRSSGRSHRSRTDRARSWRPCARSRTSAHPVRGRGCRLRCPWLAPVLWRPQGKDDGSRGGEQRGTARLESCDQGGSRGEPRASLLRMRSSSMC